MRGTSSAYHSRHGQACAWEVARQGTGEEDQPSLCLKTYLTWSSSVERRKTDTLYISQIPLNSKITLTWGFPKQVNELHVEFNCKIKYFTLLQTLPHTLLRTLLLLSSSAFPHTLFYLSLKTTVQVKQVKYYDLRFTGDTMKEQNM